jgi:hypothetical protein
MNSKSQYSLCVPIYNLRISDEIGGELNVGDVTNGIKLVIKAFVYGG